MVYLYQTHYGINVKLHDLQFYNMDQIVLHVQMLHTNNSLLIQNCTFRDIKPTMGYVNQIVYGEFLTNTVIRKLFILLCIMMPWFCLKYSLTFLKAYEHM